MTQAPAYKKTVRNYHQTPVLNSATNDYNNANGVRISTPTYIDLPIQHRKELLNAVRSIAATTTSVTTSNTHTGLSVETPSSKTNDVESYLGMSLDVLRTALFSRGGLPVDLCLKLQSVTGLEFVSMKDMTAAFKSKEKAIKDWLADYSYDSVQTTEASS